MSENNVEEQVETVVPVKKPLISEEMSKRITSLRYILILFVIFNHNYSLAELYAQHKYGLSPNDPSHWIAVFLAESFARAVVPLFFVFSAYLQYKKNDAYPVLLKKKSKAILIPLFLWPVINMGCFFIKYALNKKFPSLIGGMFPGETKLFTWWIKEKCFLGAFIGFKNVDGAPLLVQFWFLRDLFILTVLSPVIKYCVKKFPREYFIFIAFIYFCDIKSNYLANIGVFFYSIGFYCAEYDVDFFSVADKFKWKLLGPIFICIWLYKSLFGKSAVDMQYMAFAACFIILKFSKILIQNEKVFNVTKYLSGVSFFLYCVHCPFLLDNVLYGWLAVLPVSNTFWCLAEFFGAAFIVTAVGTGIALFLRKFCNPIFVLLNGGRS